MSNIAPLDLTSDIFDDNMIMKNLIWGLHRTTGQLHDPNQCHGFPFDSTPIAQTCTTQPILPDIAGGASAWFCNRVAKFAGKLTGHVNWGPATYDGWIFWDNHSSFLLLKINMASTPISVY